MPDKKDTTLTVSLKFDPSISEELMLKFMKRLSESIVESGGKLIRVKSKSKKLQGMLMPYCKVEDSDGDGN